MGNKTNNVLESNEQRYVDGFRRGAAAHAAPHKPESAKTLMRTAVKKPDLKAPSRLKVSSRADILTRVPVQVVAPKLSHANVDPKRLKKAHQMVQSPSVSRYATPSVATSQYSISPFVSRAHSTPAATAPTIRSAASDALPANVHIPVSPVTEQKVQPDIFQQALAQATSHERTFDARTLPRKKRNHVAALSTVAMSFLLIAGILAYINTPTLSIRLASSKAGFSARLPGYSPAGFSFGELSYGPGNVTVSYTEDGSDSKKFDITQRVSNWDSQSLLNNFVANANKAYQTYERAGRTVYFYGNNTATWVENGVWYTVNGNNSLTKNQLLDLAGSI